MREVGIGNKKKFDNEAELFEFFINSKEGAFMWRDHEDFAALSNIYQFVIKIITVTHFDDQHPEVTIIEPDPGFSHVGSIPSGGVPEMLLFHTKDTHYDLVVPKESKLAKEGGLDYQRKQNQEKSNNKEDNALLEEQISILEAKLIAMEEKITKLEAEKEALVEERNQYSKEISGSALSIGLDS